MRNSPYSTAPKKRRNAALHAVGPPWPGCTSNIGWYRFSTGAITVLQERPSCVKVQGFFAAHAIVELWSDSDSSLGFAGGQKRSTQCGNPRSKRLARYRDLDSKSFF